MASIYVVLELSINHIEFNVMYKNPNIVFISGWSNPDKQSNLSVNMRVLTILKQLSNRLSWVVTNAPKTFLQDEKIDIVRVSARFIPRTESSLKLILFFLIYQIKMSFRVFCLLPETDIFFFANGSDMSFIPMLLVRIMGKKVILKSDGRPSIVVNNLAISPGKIKKAIIRFSEKICYSIANVILPEAGNMVDIYKLGQYKEKIMLGSQCVDTQKFYKQKRLTERDFDVGFVGRFEYEKGIVELINALPLIRGKEIKTIVIGDGNLRSEILEIVESKSIKNVVFTGWVTNEQLPNHINNIKLIVVPSYYEGLSNLVLESMACGAIVIANNIGGIPEVILNGITGFLLEDNSSQCIAATIKKVLSMKNLESISEKAQSLVSTKYCFEAAVKRYENAIDFSYNTGLKNTFTSLSSSSSKN